jgi:hypothetical protein
MNFQPIATWTASRGAASAQTYSRSSRQIARGDDRFFIELTPSGCMSFS